MSDNFLKKLNFLVGDRKIHPWCQTMGFSSGAASKIKNGVLPGNDIQAAIRELEHCDPNWLCGNGAKPFFVEIYIKDDEFANSLNNYLNVFKNSYLVEYDETVTLVFSKPETFRTKKNEIVEYTKIKIVTGPYSHQIYKIICDNENIVSPELSSSEKRQIQSGMCGTYLLFGDDKIRGVLAGHHKHKKVEKRFITNNDKINTTLLRSTIVTINEVATDQGIALNEETKAKLIASVYAHAIRSAKINIELTDVQLAFDAILE